MRRLLLAGSTVAATFGALALSGRPAPAQTVRATGSSSLRYIEVRTLRRDSVPAGETGGSGLLRQLADGRIVRCIPGEVFCHQVDAGPVVSAIPVIHDLTLTAWGFTPGLRITAQLRGRTSFGDEPTPWPRADDHLDVLSLYGALERGRLRVTGGRQWRVSGLGVYNFDGLAVGWRPRDTWLEVYGGRSLARGLNEGRTALAMESVEDLSLPDAGLLFGAQGRVRSRRGWSLGAVYQMDLRGDRRGVYAELAAADGTLRLGRGTAEASAEFDLAGRAVNEARLRYHAPIAGDASAFGEIRRYRPYFELWTIWGAFSPVGFDEGRAGITRTSRDRRVMLRAEASWRRYGDAATDAPDEFRTSAWGTGVSGFWLPAPEWRADASWRLEGGLGAGRQEGQVGLRRDRGGGVVALQAVAFQRLYEFRVSDGTVVGIGGETSREFGDRGRITASAFVYRQHGGLPASLDWNQRRASIRFDWGLGAEPAAVPPGARQ